MKEYEWTGYAFNVAETHGIRLNDVKWFDEDPFLGTHFVGPGGAWGWSQHHTHTIMVKRGLTEPQTREVILHELTHLKIGPKRHPKYKQVHNVDFYREMFTLMVDECAHDAIWSACRFPRGQKVAMEMGLLGTKVA